MKIVQLDPAKFNELAKSEPSASFYQTTYWGEFYANLGYTPIYLGYKDDHDEYYALGLFLLNKAKGLFSRKTAICPFGFLINYFDTKLLEEFTKVIKSFLFKKGVGELIINPNVKYLTTKGDNRLIVEKMEKIGYKKTKNNFIYETKIDDIPNIKNKDNIYLSAYEIDNETSKKLFSTNANYKNLYETMGRLVKFVVCEIDSDKTIAELKKAIAEAKNYIEIHADDYKYDNKRANKQKMIVEKQEILDLLNKNENPILAVTCLIEYNNKIYQLFIDDKKEFRNINTLEFLNEKTLKTIARLGYTSYYSFSETTNSEKIELIGEFSYHI